MGVKRHALSARQWERLAPMLPGKAGDPGRTAADNRLFVNAVMWVLPSGARWPDLPERHGRFKAVQVRPQALHPRVACRRLGVHFPSAQP